MNKYQEAWNKLDDCSYITDYLSEEKYVLKELVDKATPKKPVINKDGYLACPKCHSSWAIKDYCICVTCGQALDWT